MNPGEEEGNVLLQGFERPGVNLVLTFKTIWLSVFQKLYPNTETNFNYPWNLF